MSVWTRTGRAPAALLVFALATGLCALAPRPAKAQVNFSSFYSFGPSNTGSGPQGTLIQAADGNFYSTTFAGGSSNKGTVYKITTEGVQTVLYSFAGGTSDGELPQAGLIQASDGNFYGTASVGGASGVVPSGVVFKVTTAGVETVLHSFGDGADGADPVAPLVQGADGSLYGTTQDGGASHAGVAFKITTAGVETVLHSFGGAGDGASPDAGLILASDGNFYGTTFSGGSSGNGTVFKITPEGVETILHSLAGGSTDGAGPGARLVQGTDGDFYGTTLFGGSSGGGTVFKITPAGVETVLYSFGTHSGDGNEPTAGLVQGLDGNFYGTTLGGGTGAPNGFGTVYKITPTGVETVLHSFSGADGSEPATELLLASDGSLFGTTELGGANNFGTIFLLTFTITNPTPVLNSLSPSSTDAGSPAFTLIAKGSAFLSSSTLHWNGSPLTTTFVASSELKATVPASLLANPGKAKITVVTPAPGGGTSASKSFTILVTTISLTGVSVVKNADGSYTATLSLTNTGLRIADSAAITNSSLGSAATTTTLPVSLGNLAAGATVTTKLTYPSSAGSPGSSVTLKVSGSFAGGTFSGSEKLILP